MRHKSALLQSLDPELETPHTKKPALVQSRVEGFRVQGKGFTILGPRMASRLVGFGLRLEPYKPCNNTL